MQILLNTDRVDYIIISETETVGLYDFKSETKQRYFLLEELVVEFPKPPFFERLFGRKQRTPRHYPKAFYEESIHSGNFILKSNINKEYFFIKEGEIYTKPFITIVLNGNKVGTLAFNNKEELYAYIESNFNNIKLKKFETV